jgi:hypothetical protein
MEFNNLFPESLQNPGVTQVKAEQKFGTVA